MASDDGRLDGRVALVTGGSRGIGRAIALRLAADGAVDVLFAGLRSAVGDRLDIVVNNAAIIGSGGIEELTADQVDRVLAVNVKAPLFVVQQALPLLADGGRVIMISSLVTRTNPPEVAYVMSKGALDAMTRSLAAAQGGRGITVNAVAPGLTDTDLMADAINAGDTRQRAARATAMGRVGQPDDVADVVAFLASHRARWVTGQVLDASGGIFLRPEM